MLACNSENGILSAIYTCYIQYYIQVACVNILITNNVQSKKDWG